MRKQIILFIFLSSGAVAQVPEVHVSDSTFLRAIDIFLDSTSRLKLSDQLIVIVTLRNLKVEETEKVVLHEKLGEVVSVDEKVSYSLVLALHGNIGVFKHDIPSFSIIHRGMRIFVFMGGEKLFEVSDMDRKKILNNAKKSIAGGGPNGAIILAIMHC